MVNSQYKFRAWDEKNKRMFNVARFDFADHTVYSHLFACEGYLAENLKIMQYTGLKDKNGKKIYEGDIISTDLSRPYLVVEFRNGAFMFHCHDEGKDYYDYINPPADDEINQYHWGEVIGNIYENPELIPEVRHA